MQLVPGQTLGKYTTRNFVGSGVFGSVYLMHDNLMNRDVAVKFVENQNPTAFVAHFEAQILHQCRNDRIVAINSVDVVQDTNGRYYAAIDMEYLPDGSAQKLIDGGHVSIRQSIKLAIDLLFALIDKEYYIATSNRLTYFAMGNKGEVIRLRARYERGIVTDRQRCRLARVLCTRGNQRQ